MKTGEQTRASRLVFICSVCWPKVKEWFPCPVLYPKTNITEIWMFQNRIFGIIKRLYFYVKGRSFLTKINLYCDIINIDIYTFSIYVIMSSASFLIIYETIKNKVYQTIQFISGQTSLPVRNIIRLFFFLNIYIYIPKLVTMSVTISIIRAAHTVCHGMFLIREWYLSNFFSFSYQIIFFLKKMFDSPLRHLKDEIW